MTVPPRNVDVAKGNSQALRASYDHRNAEAELQRKDFVFRHFVDYVNGNKALGVNIRPKFLLKLLTPIPGIPPTLETYKNYHDLVKANALPNDDKYKRRCAIEDMLGFGAEKEAIYYVMLNTGNEGIQRYGKYCIILKDDPTIRTKVSFLANDSYSYLFSYYGDPQRPFNIDRAEWSNVEQLIAVKHSNAIMQREEPFSSSQIDNLILDAIRPNFIEAHLYINGGFDLRHLKEVRISHEEMARFLALHAKYHLSGISNKTEYAEYWTDTEIIRYLEVANIPLRVV